MCLLSVASPNKAYWSLLVVKTAVKNSSQSDDDPTAAFAEKKPLAKIRRKGAANALTPVVPTPIAAFAKHFKGYMAGLAVIAASMPVVTALTHALEVFKDDRLKLSILTSLFCFLVLGYVFYERHALARWMFPEFTVTPKAISSTPSKGLLSPLMESHRRVLYLKRAAMTLLPLFLIVAAAAFGWTYLNRIDSAIVQLGAITGPPETREGILDKSYVITPYSGATRISYVLMFVFAEAAFILMATREYIQDLLGVSDYEVMTGERKE
jgi:hypothetical protein